MSVQPAPPSTYILKELHDVGLPESVSWLPQTLGWQILACIALVLVTIWGYRQTKLWWQNRYRREALQVAKSLEISHPKFEYQLFVVIKQVMGYLNAGQQALYGEPFITAFNAYPHTTSLQEKPLQLDQELAQKWLASLNSTRHPLIESDKQRLLQHCLHWLQSHQREANV